MKNVILLAIVLVLSACGVNERFYTTKTACSVEAQNYGTTISCPDGTSTYIPNGINGVNGLNGADGRDGVDGRDGADGRDGVDGINGTVVTVQQFCPASHVPSYPSTFPEVGMCIGGKMYGVYSANGGFLVYMPPGVYSSNGINSSCTFTLSANCQVN